MKYIHISMYVCMDACMYIIIYLSINQPLATCDTSNHHISVVLLSSGSNLPHPGMCYSLTLVSLRSLRSNTAFEPGNRRTTSSLMWWLSGINMLWLSLSSTPADVDELFCPLKNFERLEEKKIQFVKKRTQMKFHFRNKQRKKCFKAFSCWYRSIMQCVRCRATSGKYSQV